MAELEKKEPQSAADYDDRTTDAVKKVLIEIGQILGSFRGKFAVVGGAVPWLLLNNEEMPHVGSLDVDLGLDAEALGGGEYATLVEALSGKGYEQRKELKRFQLVRQVPATDGGPPIDIIVDFLMSRDAEIVKNKPPLVDNFAVQRADGAELALHFYELVAIDGTMPEGSKNRVEVAVCSIPALLAMKGHALAAIREKTRTISTTASETTLTERPLSRKLAAPYLRVQAARRDIGISPRNSARSKTMDPPVSGSLSRTRRCWESAHRTNGSRMHSGRSTPGSRLWV